MNRTSIFVTAVICCLSFIFFAFEASAQSYMPSPNIEKIKKDLCGRIIRQVEGGYFSSDWYLEIGDEDTEICDVKILDEERRNRDLLLSLSVKVRYRSTYFDTKLELSYYFGDNATWQVNFLRTIDVIPINPGRYDTCISIEYSSIGNGSTYFTNTSDVPLIVGGYRIDNSQRYRFVCKISPFSYNVVSGEASIDFVIPATF